MVTVTIHPRWHLRKGCFYEARIRDAQGHPGSDRYLHAQSKSTRNLVITLPAEGEEPPGRVTEWAPGAAELQSLRAHLASFTTCFIRSSGEVGFLEFRFLPPS
jgi:hypothetical protein